jgi:hypothetical protein
MLTEGQSVLVQVLKDPIGTKGARMSTQISIAGRMLVYLPQDRTSAFRSASNRRPNAKPCAKRIQPHAAGGRAGRLHRAHHGRMRHRRGTRGRHRLPAQDVAGNPQTAP